MTINSRKPKESDWKTFRKRVLEWRERYLKRTNLEIATLITDENCTPTEQFWKAQARIEKEVRILTDCFDDHSRSKMFMALFLMYNHDVIEGSDLQEFSSELHSRILMSGN